MRSSARIAVIGAGWWSTQTHIPRLLAHAEADLVALCDAAPDRLRAAAEAYGVRQTYSDYQTMLRHEQLDGVVIATSHASHYPIAYDCLSARLHVLVEKPLTLLAADARTLIRLAQQHERELIVGYPWNYTDLARYARELISSGALGAIQFVSCVFNSYNLDLLSGVDRSGQPAAYAVHGPGAIYSQPEHSGGGHGHLQMTHAVGLLSFITGLRARRVLALMQSHGLAVDLVDAMTVEFEQGALGSIGGTSNLRPLTLDLQIACAHGSIILDMVTATAQLRWADGTQELIGPPERPEQLYPSTAPVDNLVDIVLGRGINHSPGDVGWRTVELLDAAYRSARSGGQAVGIDELYDSGSA